MSIFTLKKFTEETTVSTLPFTLADLRKHFSALEPDSFVIHNDAAFWMQGKAKDKRLVILANAENPVFGKFQGESSIFQDHTLKICLLNHASARSRRDERTRICAALWKDRATRD